MYLLPPVLLVISINTTFTSTLLTGLLSLTLCYSITQPNIFILNLPFLQVFMPHNFGHAGLIPFYPSLQLITPPIITMCILSFVPYVPQCCSIHIQFSWRILHDLSLINVIFLFRLHFTSSTVYIVSRTFIIFQIQLTSYPVIMLYLLCIRTQVHPLYG